MNRLRVVLLSALLLLGCSDTSDLDERLAQLEDQVESLRAESQLADELLADLTDQELRKLQESVDTLCSHWRTLAYFDLPEELEGFEVWC